MSTSDSVSPLAALDVSAARRLLEELARQQAHKAEEFREEYDGGDEGQGDEATQRMLASSAEHFDRVANELRQVSAALASLDSLLPALLADGARLDFLEENGGKTFIRYEGDGWYDERQRLKSPTLREAIDAARAVRRAGAAPTENVNHLRTEQAARAAVVPQPSEPTDA